MVQLTKQWNVPYRPISVDIASDNTIVVASYSAQQVSLYSEQGDPLSQFSAPSPQYLAVNSARDRIFVTDGTRLQAYTLSAPHPLVNEWTSAQQVFSMDLAADGSMWTGNANASSGAFTVVRWNTTTGSAIQEFSVAKLPRDLAVSPTTGDLFSAAKDFSTLVRLNASDGSVLRQWGSAGSGNCQFGYFSVAVDDAGNVLVGDPNQKKVKLFSPDGDYLCTLASGVEAVDVAVSASGFVVAVGYSYDTAYRFDPWVVGCSL